MTSGRSAAGLVGFLAATYAAAGLGAAFTAPSVGTWYQQLARPPWTPPDWLFGPVWTLLYTLMAVAAWRVWRRGGWAGAPGALALFGVQLALNAAWSPIFFGLHRTGLAMLDLAALWVAIVATVLVFRRASGLAAGLMLPYLAWVTFAGALNFAIWRMNG